MNPTRTGRWREMRRAALSFATAVTLGTALGACGSGSAHPTNVPTHASAPSPTSTIDTSTRPSAGCAATRQRPDANASHTLRVAGVNRTYRIATPPRNTPAPLIVLLHGLGSNAADIDRVSDFPRRGTAAGMIVVTPDAIGAPAIWRVGGQGPDAAFLDALIGDVEAHDCVDTRRVSVVGFSVGALFAIIYSCARQNRVAAIVTVEVDTPGGCTKPMSMLAFHGTADPIVPYAPPRGSTALGGGAGTEANLANWAKIAGCAPTASATKIASEVTKYEWPNCANGSEVILYKIRDGVHDWPGRGDTTSATEGSMQVSATNEAIMFAARHALHS